ncbi:MAG TPA: hypothetical protein VJ819_10570 [Nocardioidaceae bacterium]|nr:hypothetical protein [Nocardioidaceae bacterium]
MVVVIVAAGVVVLVRVAGSGNELAADDTGGRFSATGVVIETPEHGPMVASTGLLEAEPPAGGDIPLMNWRWAQAEELGVVEESMGTRWTSDALTVEGTWDGSTLAVDRVMAASDDPGPIETPRTCTHPVDVRVLNDTSGVIGWSTQDDGGLCTLTVIAVGPSSRLDATLATLGEHVEVEYLLSRID